LWQSRYPQCALIGTASAAIEAAATTVGAGVLLGGFVAGTVQRLLYDDGRREDDGKVVDVGYGGGWVAGAALMVDLL
jgi:hypothetical protein